MKSLVLHARRQRPSLRHVHLRRRQALRESDERRFARALRGRARRAVLRGIHPHGRRGRAVVGFHGSEPVASEFPVLAIEGGRLVADPSASEAAHKAAAGAPVAADGTRARLSALRKADASASPIALRAFLEQVRGVALKAPLTKRAIRRGDGGRLLKMVDGRVVAEPLKDRARRTQTAASSRDSRAGGQDAPGPALSSSGARRHGVGRERIREHERRRAGRVRPLPGLADRDGAVPGRLGGVRDRQRLHADLEPGARHVPLHR